MISIPKSTCKDHFYVARDVSKAFSSWDSLDDALMAWELLKKHFADAYYKVVGVVWVDRSGSRWAARTNEGLGWLVPLEVPR